MGDKAARHRGIAYVILISLLLIAGCAVNDGPGNSNNDKNSGFYGGVTSGGSRP